MSYKRLKPADHVNALHFIATFARQHGAPPSLREIANHLCIQTTAGLYRVRELERKGYITRAEGRRARCIRLTQQGYMLLLGYRVEEGEAI
jgi:DNA-binding MarR family transcriptional regulator